jgi:diguanylate cyclase (GGDEF)-like protein/putative nucleotidyltransferase with HDIG domain
MNGLMADPEPARIVDVSEVQLRIAMVKAAVWLAFTICAATASYVAVTWGGMHRSLILSLLGGVAISGLSIVLLPIQRIVRSRFSEIFFILWSLVQIALIGAIFSSDGGGSSPLSVLFFLPLVFAALFYPLRSFVPVGAVDVLTFVAVGAGNNSADPTYLGFVAACLASTAVMCAWQAQNHDQQREQLTLVSRTDPLTGCLNRRGFGERVAAELQEALRTGRVLTLMLFDLDNFKAINDVEGHAAGDELLCWVVNEVKETVRPNDSVGRLGGDEFAVLAPGASQPSSIEIAQRIHDALAKRVSATTGVACFPVDGVDREELYRVADARLYEMKHGDGAHVGAAPRELSWAAALARVVDARMALRAEHSTRVAEYAAGIAQQLGWSGEDLEHLRIAATLHDVGKMPVPDHILQKPGRLNEEEYEQVKKHSADGAEMVSRVESVAVISPWIRHSHENFDGTGYPDGLSGEAIPLASRILLVADAFDAMTSDRPYRPALPVEAALDQLRRNSGRQFDPRCVEAFEACIGMPSEPLAAERLQA